MKFHGIIKGDRVKFNGVWATVVRRNRGQLQLQLEQYQGTATGKLARERHGTIRPFWLTQARQLWDAGRLSIDLNASP